MRAGVGCRRGTFLKLSLSIHTKSNTRLSFAPRIGHFWTKNCLTRTPKLTSRNIVGAARAGVGSYHGSAANGGCDSEGLSIIYTVHRPLSAKLRARPYGALTYDDLAGAGAGCGRGRDGKDAASGGGDSKGLSILCAAHRPVSA